MLNAESYQSRLVLSKGAKEKCVWGVNRCMQHMVNKVFCVIVVFLLHPLEKLGHCAIKQEGLLDSVWTVICLLVWGIFVSCDLHPVFGNIPNDQLVKNDKIYLSKYCKACPSHATFHLYSTTFRMQILYSFLCLIYLTAVFTDYFARKIFHS